MIVHDFGVYLKGMHLIPYPIAPPTAITGRAHKPKPITPTDCKTATVEPAVTPPPKAIAAVDIIPAAVLPAAIPPDVKPRAATVPYAVARLPIAPTVTEATDFNNLLDLFED